MESYEKPSLNIVVGPWAKWAKAAVLLLDDVAVDEIESLLREMGMCEESVKEFTAPLPKSK